MTSALVAVAILGCLGPAHQATAQPTMNDTAVARALFRDGLSLADSGDWAGAADRFARSAALRPSPVVSFNLGHALERLDRLVEASEAYRVAAQASDRPEVAAEAQRALAALEPRLGRLTVEVIGATEGVEITLDDRPLRAAELGVPLPADPGAHEVRATRDGVVLQRTAVDIEAGADATARVTVPLPEPELEAAEEVAPGGLDFERAETGGGPDPALVTLGVLGGLAVVAAIVIPIVLVTGGPQPEAGTLMPGVLNIGR